MPSYGFDQAPGGEAVGEVVGNNVISLTACGRLDRSVVQPFSGPPEATFKLRLEGVLVPREPCADPNAPFGSPRKLPVSSTFTAAEPVPPFLLIDEPIPTGSSDDSVAADSAAADLIQSAMLKAVRCYGLEALVLPSYGRGPLRARVFDPAVWWYG